MPGFNGVASAPINLNNKEEIRNLLDVYSKEEIDNTLTTTTDIASKFTITDTDHVENLMAKKMVIW